MKLPTHFLYCIFLSTKMHLPFYANPISNNETKFILKERLRNECLELKSEFGEISREHLHRAVYAKACLKVNSLKKIGLLENEK